MSGYIDWVISVRAGDANEELRYAIRSVRANVRGVRDIVIAGYRPAWLDGVRHISVPQEGNKFENVVRNWRAVAEHPEVSDRFIFANDDEFAMHPIHVEQVVLRHRGRLDLHIRRLTALGHNAAWRRRLESTRDLLVTLGRARPLSCALHIPMLVDRDRMARMYCELGDRIIGHDPMTIYGAAYAPLSLSVPERVERDVKITGKDTDPSECEWRDWQWLSTSDSSFRHHSVGQYIRESFPAPSEHESDVPGHVPAQVRLTDMGYTYRNGNTGDVQTFRERNARLDRLPNWKLISSPPASPKIVETPAPAAPAMRVWLDYRGREFEVPEDSTMYDGACTHALFAPDNPAMLQAITRCGRRACPTKLRQIPAPAGKERVDCPGCLAVERGAQPDDWAMSDAELKRSDRPEPATFD